MRLYLLGIALAVPAMAQNFDVAIRNGRVMDPETKLDAVRNIGIRNGRIAAITTSPITGKETIDAKGLVIAPGFIDLHAHGQDRENNALQAHDGVTTALELEIGTEDIDRWYAAHEKKMLINYGASVGHVRVRMQVMHDPSTSLMPTGDGAHKPATDAEIEAMARLLRHGLDRGALAVGFGIQYVPAATRWEILEMFRVAAEYHASAHVHMRYSGWKEPLNSYTALEEVLAAAAVSGAPLHVVHITSTGVRAAPQLLNMIAGARSHGIDVTTECYPYTAGMTYIESSVFDPGWREARELDYKDLQWAATGERLTAETYEKYRKQGGLVAIHEIPPEIANIGVGSPLTLIASDSIMTNGKGHPRTAGTFSRVLGHYVREEHALTLMDALAKMTIRPAQRLEARVPAMRNKGRIREGADADLTVFDPATVADRATYEHPTTPSQGIAYVLVNGQVLIRKGELLPDLSPGRPVLAPVRAHAPR